MANTNVVHAVGSCEDDGKKRKALLLSAAKTLFSRKGYDGVSVKELADRAQVNVSLVSYYFGGKEGLYRACIEQYGRERLDAAQRILQPAESFEEYRVRLTLFVEEMFRAHLESPEVCKMLHRETEIENSMVHDIFQNTFLRSFECLVSFIQAAQKRRLIKTKISAMTIGGTFFASILHFAQHDGANQKYYNQTLRESKYRSKVIEDLISLHLTGVLSGVSK